MAINVQQDVYRVVIDQNNPNYYIPAEIGMAKGDIIVFNDAGSPVRFAVANVADKALLSDPTTETGLKWGTVSGGGGSGGGSALVTLTNNSGSTIVAGAVVTLDEEGSGTDVRKATALDEQPLFISSDDYADGDEMECYAFPNTICNVMCDENAIAVGDKICVGSTSGLGTAGEFATIGLALTAKAAGLNGLVKVLLMNYERPRYTVSTVDLEDGVSTLTAGHFYYFYEASEPEEQVGE